MKCLFSILICFLLLSCKRGHEPKVEIYLLKERKQFINCIPFSSTEEYKRTDLHRDTDWIVMQASIDTTDNKLVYAGEFDAAASDIKETPLVTNDEIKEFHIKGRDNYIKVDDVAYEKIKALKPKNSQGVQFAIAVDGKPVLTGFFWSPISRFRCDTYEIDVFSGDEGIAKNNFYIYEGKKGGDFLVENIKYPEKLLGALRQTNRLTE